jgi:hypothetical protein
MSHRARRRALIISGSAVVAGFTVMAPAYAAASGHSAATATTQSAAVPRTPSGALVRSGGPVAHLVGPQAAHRGTRNQTSSENWSGYAASSSTYTNVSASWVEPTGTCSSGDQYSSFWVGLDGYNSSTVEQTGSEVDCTGSTPQYYSWYEMYPAYPVNFSDPVHPGDQFTGSVTYTGNNSFTLKLSDTTAGWTRTVTQTLAGAARSSAEVIAEAPCCTSSGGILPLTDFGTVNFTGATVNGTTSGNGTAIGNSSPTGIDMVSASGVQEDSISALTSGEDFTGTWMSTGNSKRRGGPRG